MDYSKFANCFIWNYARSTMTIGQEKDSFFTIGPYNANQFNSWYKTRKDHKFYKLALCT